MVSRPSQRYLAAGLFSRDNGSFWFSNRAITYGPTRQRLEMTELQEKIFA